EAVEQLVWRTPNDAVATVGGTRTRRWDRRVTLDAVAAGILGGVEPLSEDTQRALNDRRFLARLTTRLLQAVKTKSPAEFERWLSVERAQGFYRLLGPDFARVPPEEARPVLRAAFRTLTWTAMQLMARCYGAWA